MTTLTFYNIEQTKKGPRLFKLHHYENLRGYSVNFNNYAYGSFYVVNEDGRDTELSTMFNKSVEIGVNRYILTQPKGERYVIDIVDGEAKLRDIHEPTLDLMYGLFSSITFDDVDLDKLEAIIRREGSKGVVHFFQMKVMEDMDKIPYPITEAKNEN